MMFPKFWIQSDIDRSMKLDNSDSCEVRSEMECLVYCIVWDIGFRTKLTKWLLPPYYNVTKVLGSIRYWLVHEIGEFWFVWSSFWNRVVGVLYSSRDWISLKTHQMTSPTVLWCSTCFGLNPISIGPWNWTIQARTELVLKWSCWCVTYF